MDISPDRVSRGDRTPPRYPGGDRYRPGQNYRDPYTTPRSDYDSYRPQYEDGWAHLPARDSTGLVDSFRRDSIAVPHSRSSSHNNSNGRRVSDPISFTGSISPRSRPRSPPYLSRHTYPVRSPSRGRALASRSDHNDNDKQHRPSMDLVEPTSKKLSSRSSSRSSIASTHVSVLSPPRPPSSHLPQLEKPAFEVIQPVVINGTTTHDKVLERTYSPPCPPKSNFAITNDLPQDSMADAVKSNDTASTSCPGSPAFPQKRLKRDSFSSTETLPVQPVSAFPKEESVIGEKLSSPTPDHIVFTLNESFLPQPLTACPIPLHLLLHGWTLLPARIHCPKVLQLGKLPNCVIPVLPPTLHQAPPSVLTTSLP